MICRLVGSLLAVGGVAGVAGVDAAQPSNAPPASAYEEAEHEHARPRLISETSALVPGQIAMIGVTFEIDEHWHLYWDGINDSGMPPQIELTLPPGLERLPTQWPAPMRHLNEGDILDHTYEGVVTILVPIKVSPDLEPGTTVTIDAQLMWLVCREACIREEGTRSISLPVVATATEATASKDAGLIAATRTRLPQKWPKQGGDKPESDAIVPVATMKGLELQITAMGAASISFYPETTSLVPEDLVNEGHVEKDTMTIRFRRPPATPPLTNLPKPGVRGMVEIRKPGEKIGKVYSLELVL
jgi:DsbC/DsbD-like thiol-disulfide interchange protein